MKKCIAFLMALALVMTLSACRCAKEPVSDPTTTPTTATTESTKPSGSKTLPGTMEENINKIMEENPVEFMGGVIPLDLEDVSEDALLAFESYTGLKTRELIKEGAVYEPMMGSQAFSLVLVRVTDPAKAEQVARDMKANIDPRKWICVQADQVMLAGYGDVVMFIMLDSALGKTAQSYVDAFEKVCGSKPDFTL
ncbi:MAG: hypothetical protein IJX01_08165 [Oscillospiraceae bacterium]|nr:hypothetical protein [Oscillospiraceae bacterium]